MKRRKLISYLLTFAMVLTWFAAIKPAEAKAGDADTYNVVGAEALTGANWNAADDNVMVQIGENVYQKICTVATAGTYEYKVIKNKDWNELSSATDGTWTGAANSSITVDTANTTVVFTLTLNGDKASYTVEQFAADTAHTYNLAGEEGLVGESWKADSTNVMKQIGANKFQKICSVETAKKYSYKVIKDKSWTALNTDGTWAAPEANIGNSEVTVSKNGATVVFTLTINGDEATCTSVEFGGTAPTPATETPATEAPASEPPATEAPAGDEDGDTLIVHIKNTAGWETANLHTWGQFGDTTWPGEVAEEDADNAGWFTKAVELTDLTSPVGIILNDGNGNQSVDITANETGTDKVNVLGTLVSGKNEIWVVLGEADAAGHLTAEKVSKPADWVDSDVVISTPAPEVEDEEGEDEEEGEGEGGEVSADDANIKIHFLNSEGWEKVGIYLTSADWSTEYSGAWPGSEMTLEKGSKTWYAYYAKADADKINFIPNNFEEDKELIKQTINLENYAAGEYWIVLKEAGEDGKFTAEVLDKAPDNYDGQGIDAVSDLSDGGNGGTGTNSPKTGDVAPVIPFLVLATFSAAGVYYVKRKRIA